MTRYREKVRSTVTRKTDNGSGAAGKRADFPNLRRFLTCAPHHHFSLLTPPFSLRMFLPCEIHCFKQGSPRRPGYCPERSDEDLAGAICIGEGEGGKGKGNCFQGAIAEISEKEAVRFFFCIKNNSLKVKAIGGHGPAACMGELIGQNQKRHPLGNGGIFLLLL